MTLYGLLEKLWLPFSLWDKFSYERNFYRMIVGDIFVAFQSNYDLMNYGKSLQRRNILLTPFPTSVDKFTFTLGPDTINVSSRLACFTCAPIEFFYTVFLKVNNLLNSLAFFSSISSDRSKKFLRSSLTF